MSRYILLPLPAEIVVSVVQVMRDARCAVSRRLQAETFPDELPCEVCRCMGVCLGIDWSMEG